MRGLLKSQQDRLLAVLLTPATLYLGFFFLLPLLLVFGVSLATARANGGVDWQFSLESYITVFDGSKPYRPVFTSSLRIGIVTTIVCFIIGYPLAFFIATRKVKWRAPLLLGIMIPFWTNFVIRTYAWRLLLRPGGIINTALGTTDNPLPIFGTELAVIIVLVYSWLPDMVLPCYAAIENLDRRLVEAAQDLYANDLRAFLRVILPLTAPGIVAGSILVFIPALGAYIVPLLIGAGKVPMLGTVLEREFLAGRNWPLGSALSFVLMAVMLLGTLLYFRAGTGRSNA